ncbi:MFS transporter [Nocardiopsis alba]|uniref:MFS transporter n=1 Tax=Nocardiopsis alba TaxID=53437 RepID=UPI0033B072AD
MSTEIPRRATWREWLALAVMTLPLLMVATDMTVLFLALPSITADLSPSGTQMLWFLHAGEFLAVSLALTMGWLGSKVGRRRLLMTGIALYGLASLAAAFSPNPEALIASRALMGVAAATIMPSVMALLRVMFAEARQFSLAVAVVMSSFSTGMALGPPLGGLVLEHFWWGAVFLLNVPVAALLLLSAPLLPSRKEEVEGGVDIPSVLLSMAAIIALVYGLQEIAESVSSGGGPLWPYTTSVAVGLVLAVVFVRRQLRLPEPLMDMRLFATPAFSTSLGVMLLMLLGIGAADMLLVQYLQTTLGISPGQAGLLMIAPAVASIVGGMVAPLLVRWMRPSYAMGGGLLLGAGSALALGLMVGRTGVIPLIVAASVLALALGPLFTLGANLIVVSAPVRRAGSAAAMSDVGGGLGYALSLAVLGSLSTLVYRSGLTGPGVEDLSPQDLEAAGESVGGAVGVAAGLPAEEASGLLDTAFASFATAVQTGYVFGAIVLVPAGLGVLWLLRHTRLDATEETDDDRASESGTSEDEDHDLAHLNR